MALTTQIKPQSTPRRRPRPMGENVFDALREIRSDVQRSLVDDFLKPIPEKSVEQLFPWAHNQAGKLKEEILFDGEEERKKQASLAREAANKQKIVELQMQIRAEREGYRSQVEEIVETVEQIAKKTGLETPTTIKQLPKTPGRYHVVFFIKILADFRKKADEAQEWQRTQHLRVRTKPARGSLLWTGDQKKVHEAGGTFLLQG